MLHRDKAGVTIRDTRKSSFLTNAEKQKEWKNFIQLEENEQYEAETNPTNKAEDEEKQFALITQAEEQRKAANIIMTRSRVQALAQSLSQVQSQALAQSLSQVQSQAEHNNIVASAAAGAAQAKIAELISITDLEDGLIIDTSETNVSKKKIGKNPKTTDKVAEALIIAKKPSTLMQIINGSKLHRAITFGGENLTGRLLTIATTHGAMCPIKKQIKNVTVPPDFRCLYGQYVTEAGTTNISDPDAINKLIKLIIPMLQNTNVDTSADDFDKVLYDIMYATVQSSVNDIMPDVITEVNTYISELRANTSKTKLDALRDRLRWLTFLAGCAVDIPVFKWTVIKGAHTINGTSYPATPFPEKWFIKEETTGRKTADWKLVTTPLPALSTNMHVKFTAAQVESRLKNNGYEPIQPNVKNIFPKILEENTAEESGSLSQIFAHVNEKISNNYTFIDFTCYTVLNSMKTFTENIKNEDLARINEYLKSTFNGLLTLNTDPRNFVSDEIKTKITDLLNEFRNKIAAINARINVKAQKLQGVRGGGYTNLLSNTFNMMAKKVQIKSKSKTKKRRNYKSKRRNNRKTYRKKSRSTRRRRY
jgi:hypothetical protein